VSSTKLPTFFSNVGDFFVREISSPNGLTNSFLSYAGLNYVQTISHWAVIVAQQTDQSEPLASHDAGRGADERVRGKEWPRLAGEDDDDTRPPDHPPERGSISVPVATVRTGRTARARGDSPLSRWPTWTRRPATGRASRPPPRPVVRTHRCTERGGPLVARRCLLSHHHLAEEAGWQP
jgi:hypothetical protein